MEPRRAAVALIMLAFGLLLLAPADAPAAKIYFIDFDYGARRLFSLQRVNPDGTGRETVVPDIGTQPWNNSLTVYGDRVYWRNFDNEIRAATTGGVPLGPVPAPNAHVAAALYDRVLDSSGVYTYFGQYDTGAIVRTRDGESPETLVAARQFSPPASVALDETAGKIYWAGSWNDRPSGLVQRADLADGSNVETLLEAFTADDYHVDLALDPANGKLYLGNTGLDKIQRANLDGTGLEDIVTGTDVWAIAIDPAAVPEPGMVGALGLYAGWVLMRRR